MKFALIYESAERVHERAPLHFDAHFALMRAFHPFVHEGVVRRWEVRSWKEGLA